MTPILGTMLGVVLSENLLLMVMFWELTSISSFLLIAYWSHLPAARQGARLALTITGGGALLGGLDQRLSHETGMPIRIADEPLYSVVIGSGRALENIDAMRGLMSMGGED